MSKIRALFFSLVLLSISTPAIAEEDYFAPVVKTEREALETMVNEIGIQLSDVRIYKTVSEIKTIDHKLASKVLYRKKINDGYNWVESKKGQQYVNLNLGLPKSPNIAINEKGRIIAINIKKTKTPFENSYHLSHFKELKSFAVILIDECNNNTIKNLPVLKSLENLFLNCSEKVQFPDLSKFPMLSTLQIRRTDLKQLEINKKNNLRILITNVKANADKITEFEKLKHLSYLRMVVRNPYTNKITDLNWLSSMSNLKKLYLHGSTTVKAFNSLGNLKKLMHLNLGLNSIEALPELSELNNLESIRLKVHQLKSLPPFKNMTNLKKLVIEETKLTSLGFLADVTPLVDFDLFQSPVRSMKPLENLVNLENLELTRTGIKKIEGLENMSKLKSLEISESPVTRIEGLENLQALESLDLSYLKIEKLENLDNLNNLKKIRMPEFKRTKENYAYLKQLKEKDISLISIITPWSDIW